MSNKKKQWSRENQVFGNFVRFNAIFSPGFFFNNGLNIYQFGPCLKIVWKTLKILQYLLQEF